MKLRFLFLIMFCIMGSSVFPTLTGTLPELLNPKMIRVSGTELFAAEDDAIYVYNLADLKLKVKFGKKGAGPSEFQVWPFQSIWFKVFPDKIVIVTFDKILYFSKDGKFIKEMRKNYLTTQITPVGKNFVGKGSRIDLNSKQRFVTINLFDANLAIIKELYSQKFPEQGTDIDFIMDFLNFKVFDEKIFIEESPMGFLIEVFDTEGNKLYAVDNKYEKRPVTKKDKDAAIEKFKDEPTVKNQGWENIKNLVKIHFPDYFPPIRNFEVDNDKIYVQTYQTKDDKDEYVILDLKGKLLKTLFLPHQEQPFWLSVLDVKLFSIVNDKFYYLKENETEEKWELYTEEIKY